MKNTFKCLLSAALVLLLALAPVGVFAAASNNDDGWTGDYIIPSIQAIEIQQLPKKLSYLLNEKLDLTGLRVQSVDKSGTVKPVEAVLSGSVDLSAPGVKQITVAAKGKKANFKISCYQNGDVNGNFSLGLDDAVLLSRNIAGWNVAESIVPICLDVDQNNEVNLKDVVCLVTALLNS